MSYFAERSKHYVVGLARKAIWTACSALGIPVSMATLKRFLHYLKETYLEAGDIFDNAMRIVTLLLFVGVILSNWVAPHVESLAIMEDPALEHLFERGFIVVLVLWGFLWVPFKKREAVEAELAALKEQFRFKLKLVCSHTNNRCSATSVAASMHYFRIQVTLDCHQAVSGCCGNLISIRRESDGVFVRDHEVDKLPFSPSEATDCISKTLSPNIPETLDLLAIHIPTGNVCIPRPGGGATVATTHNQQGTAFAGLDAYILVVRVTGVGIPTQEVEVRFLWTGDYKTAELSIVS